MSIGQAYADILTPREQQALAEACDWLIDHAFDERERIEKPQDVLDSVVGEYLPTRYVYRYTPLFFKKFAVCIITVAWKLAQSEHMLLSSLAEELAARAIIQEECYVIERGLPTEARSPCLSRSRPCCRMACRWWSG